MTDENFPIVGGDGSDADGGCGGQIPEQFDGDGSAFRESSAEHCGELMVHLHRFEFGLPGAHDLAREGAHRARQSRPSDIGFPQFLAVLRGWSGGGLGGSVGEFDDERLGNLGGLRGERISGMEMVEN